MVVNAPLPRLRPYPLGGSIVGVILLIASGVGYRALAARYASVGRATPIPKGTLAHLPLEWGEWNGRDVPLDEAVIRRTDTDDHLNRSYIRRDGRAAVSVFIGYGVNIRDLMPHR
ncbi:MAG: exosortase-associated EpsI family protein, partial [Phycisphaerales bacterium]|nr:exosortase-associated EpsI family protein [Phycisphaerales bacterium]